MQQSAQQANASTFGPNSQPNCDIFASHFLEKSKKIENELQTANEHLKKIPPRIPHSPQHVQTLNQPELTLKNKASWNTFKMFDENDILTILTSLKPSNHFCDPLPANIFSEIKTSLIPLWTKIVNTSLLQGTLPSA